MKPSKCGAIRPTGMRVGTQVDQSLQGKIARRQTSTATTTHVQVERSVQGNEYEGTTSAPTTITPYPTHLSSSLLYTHQSHSTCTTVVSSVIILNSW